MKKLILIFSFILCILNSYTQFHYEVNIEPLNNYHKKEIITFLRNNNIKLFNLIMNDTVTFDSPNSFDSLSLSNMLSNIATINYFKKYKNNLTFYNEKVGGTNCSNAGQLCTNATVSGNSSGHGTQELNSGNRGCLNVEHQSSWYYIYIQNSGTLEMNITSSNSNDDYDFAIWGAFNISTAINNCPPINNPIRCSYSACRTSTGLGSGYGCRSCGLFGIFTCYGTRTGNDTSEGSSGDSWLLPLNVSAGDVYLLLVDNYSASNSNYTITWGGTATLGCVVVNLGATIEYFNVTNNKTLNSLEFKTIRESNIDYFSILHSTDGFIWNQITKIQPSNTINGNLYSFNHNTEYKHNYYKLKIVDLDGNIEIHDKILLIENEPIVFIKYYNIMGQEVSPDTKGVLLAIDINGNIHKIFR